MTDHHVHALPNGIRILFKHSPSPITHCCFVLNAGSRDELPQKEGLAHFIEHLLFKETERRNTPQILNRLELVGADLNAYTTKEYTCIHASLLKQHLERTVDLFEDILFHSTFPEDEMEKERGVILDEISSYLDQPEEAIQDDFEEYLFKGHPIGNNILGTPESVGVLNGADIKQFITANNNTHQMIFAVYGDYDFKKLVKLCEKYFGSVPENTNQKQRIAPEPISHGIYTLKKPISQTHCIIGGRAYPSAHQNKYGLLLLNNVLGGMGMSNRLNLEIREKHGIAYTIESNYTSLTDTGIFSIYFGTDAEKAGKALKLTHKELKKLRENKLGAVQLRQAKEKFIGQIALAEESRMSLIISMAKSLMDFGRIDSLEDIFAKINAVTAEDLLEISNEIFDNDRMITLLFEPK
ncbi:MULTISPECIES: pitrilysin family protein [unclassified Mucilaginibacter]|uniref:M16 family metallopeptidase n=1 Tax=unclassified Mucilaginibacter TaxID=2617802 RepID=UPI002AC8E694|nr:MULTISPECIES: pitrilysin family protein [unclassified Mucilaginibacter]MEB0263292.1 pitrilysin family protein [Mucilaginibacter sp. 10I4]MEB0278301.1 pitrilysin family protein [Mucilaginibacter sp. 10B2]MEB0301200.1 pitrilysin family protein [Mucilaginibacter sp. 5C4]WPX23947.1 pitrilysin family protein [Mucilaginibacter sp. 5C4]